ncbi:MAG: hypothetical protein BWX77_00473 [Bacteroidetes bacterium ADurb.Bin090]|nr:MAG: hypothetical protein BWX77_00473 [Bacteroidetes bacterium ADurb.Bin090]
MGDMQLVGYSAHQFNRTQGTGHDACAQRGNIKHLEHRVIQNSDKHGGHSIQSRATFLLNGCQHHQWIEAFHHHLSTTVGQNIHGGQYYSETMEKRHRYTELIFGCKGHMLAGKIAVVHNVVVRKHYSFGKTRSSRSILHIHHIVAVYAALDFIQFVVVDVLAQQQ